MNARREIVPDTVGKKDNSPSSSPRRMVSGRSGNQTLHAALLYASRGWALGPTWGLDPARPSECSCPNHGCASPGKHPVTGRGVHDFSSEVRMVHRWWARHPTRGIGLATGDRSGVWALDVDGALGASSLRDLTKRLGSLPDTVTSRTGGGGWHLLFRMPEDREVRNSAGKVGLSVDVRGNGGFIVLPPSLHLSGRRYRWLPGRGPEEISLAMPPDWLLELATPTQKKVVPVLQWQGPRGSRYVAAALERECTELARTSEGSRNDRLYRAACSLARFVAAGEADAFMVARELARAAERAGLGRPEIARTLESAFSARSVS